jgi:hypothetical protein
MINNTLKIYGERNCGTNFLYWLIYKNLNIDLYRGVVSTRIPYHNKEIVKDIYFGLTFSNNLGWKHMMAPSAQKIEKATKHENLCILTITKNPYSYLLSMYKRPYHYKKPVRSFYEFLQTPWKTVGRENYKRKSFSNPIELWNKKNSSYVELSGNKFLNVINLKYEDLLANPQEEIKKIAYSFNLSFPEKFANVNRSTKNDKDMDFERYRNYYLNEEWQDKLSRKSINLINQYLDKEQMEYFGYQIL